MSGYAVFITDRPLHPSYPSGFVGRYRAIVEELCERYDRVTLVTVRMHPDPNDPIEDLVSSSFSVQHLDFHYELHAAPTTRPQRAFHYVGRLVRGVPPGYEPVVPAALLCNADLVIVAHARVLGALEHRAVADVDALLVEELFERRNGSGITSKLTARCFRRTYRRLADRTVPCVLLTEHERELFVAKTPGVHASTFPLCVDPPIGWRVGRRAAGQQVVGIFGRLVDRRNLEEVCEILRRDSSGARSWRIVGAITDSGADSIRNAAGSTPVELVGPVRSLWPHYAGLSAVVVPAREVSGEKSTILQAWSAGIPVVATTESAAANDLTDGRDGFIYRSVSECLTLLDDLAVADPAFIESVIVAGRTRLEGRSCAETAARIVDFCSA